jgi:hypothetical protein
MFAGALSLHEGVDVLLETYGGLDSAILLVRLGLRCHNMPYRFANGVIVAKNVSHDDVL